MDSIYNWHLLSPLRKYNDWNKHQHKLHTIIMSKIGLFSYLKHFNVIVLGKNPAMVYNFCWVYKNWIIIILIPSIKKTKLFGKM